MLAPRDRPAGDDGHPVGYRYGIARIVHQILSRAYEIFLVFRMLHIAVNAHRYRVGHRHLDDDSFEYLRSRRGGRHTLCGGSSRTHSTRVLFGERTRDLLAGL